MSHTLLLRGWLMVVVMVVVVVVVVVVCPDSSQGHPAILPFPFRAPGPGPNPNLDSFPVPNPNLGGFLPRKFSSSIEYLNDMERGDVKPKTSNNKWSVPSLVESYSGYINVNTTYNSSLFYQYYPPMDGNTSAPVLLWLQGGPGCSSIGMGNLYENGPFRMQMNGSLAANPYTWASSYHLVFIDQPVGTGFSFTEDPRGFATSEEDVSRDLLKAVQVFLAANVLLDQDFYIFGESYAGKYAPSLASAILTSNANGQSPINLRGIGVGNGLTDPVNQIEAYGDYGYINGLIDAPQRTLLEAMQRQAVAAIGREEWMEASNLYNNITFSLLMWGGWVNPADIREYGFASLNFTAGQNYLNEPSVQKSMNIPEWYNFTMCSDEVQMYMMNDTMQSVGHLLVPLLDASVKVLLFNGQFDLTIPNNSAENWVGRRIMGWEGEDGFRSAPRNVWTDQNGATAGFVRSYGNLTQAIVSSAGHMACMDQPKNMQQLVTEFIESH